MRIIIVISIGIFLYCVCTHNAYAQAAENKPNIILIMSDDQGWGDLSINGNRNLHTPNIDRLAEKGVQFNHFYVSPVCSPTRAELLTGRYHPRVGVYSTSEGGERINLEEETIVIYLSDNGPNSWRWNGDMKGRKGSTDEGGVRSPLIFQWTGTIPSGSKVNEIAGSIDLLPTLTALAGIDVNSTKPLDGVSLKPLLLETNEKWTDRHIFAHWNGRTSVRSQKYRMDDDGKLFDMSIDPSQSTDVSKIVPDVADQLALSIEKWKEDVIPNISVDQRRFPIGHPDFKYTQLPARDAHGYGNIVRSNQFPNDSFFTQWISIDDKITWDVEVLSTGDYEVEIYYTCPSEDVGATFQLSLGSDKLTAKITDAHDPPLKGIENDLVERNESYVKDFKSLTIGSIRLNKGSDQLILKALDIPASQVMDFRLLMLTKK